MASYDTQATPDYSPLLVHLIRDGEMSARQFIDENHPLYSFKDVAAKARLENILVTKTVYGSPMPWLEGNPQAVCFTECMWRALVRHTETYSSYGIVFNKRIVFRRGGGPALYVRGDDVKSFASSVSEAQRAMIAPFDPEGVIKSGVRLDFLPEREWRLPGSLMFDYSDIEYVIVDSIRDAHDIAMTVGAQHVPQNRFISMEAYRVIRTAWGNE